MANPSHTYVISGFFDVSLQVTNGFLTRTVARDDYGARKPFRDI